MPTFSQRLRSLIWREPFGEVVPPRPDPPPQPHDGRTAALKVLKLYLSELTFYRAGDVGGPPVPFQVPSANIKIEPSEDADDAQLPAVTFVPAEGTSDALGLGNFIEEESRDVYWPGTVVQWMSEYRETFTIEVVAPTIAMRRGLVAGIVAALTPTECMFGIRFKMPSYYNQLVAFQVQKRSLSRDYGSNTKRRFIAEIQVMMVLTEVALVNYVETNMGALVDVKAPGDAFNPATAAELADDGAVTEPTIVRTP
jgi:hypothetical protein